MRRIKLKDNPMKFPLARPDITDKEIQYVTEVLRTPYLSLGPKHREFEAAFARYLGRLYAVAVSSGTAGLHLAIRALSIKEEDEVITTPFSFVASSNAILFERAKPIFVDIDPRTLNVDSQEIVKFIESFCVFDGKVLKNKKTKATVKAILPVHVFGHPCEMDRIMDIAEIYNLTIIEDACEAIGAEYKTASAKYQMLKGRKVGTFGNLAVFAFYPNKQITTGEGGMVVTDDEELAELIKSLRNQGRGNNSLLLEHIRLGYNYRMDELSAALGLAQLERIEEMLKKRERVAHTYNSLLHEIDEVELPYVASNVKMSWFVYVIRVKDKINRDILMRFLLENGVECRPYFTPIHLQPFYKEMFGFKEGHFPIAESASKRTLALPFYNNLKKEDITFIVEKLKEGLLKSKV